jgi:sugar O-acyltransferase (sialic acid O-acetyltransferase NeuD family)
MSNKFSVFGFGGHGRSVFAAILSNGHDCVIFDDNLSDNLCKNNLKFGGNINDFKNTKNRIVAIGDNKLRKKIITKYKIFDDLFVNHSSAIVSNKTVIKGGSVILANSVLNYGSEIGVSTIVNTGAIVEHDCRIGNFVHLAPGSILCGNVTVGDDAFIGAGAIVKQNIHIGRGAIIGAGSVIIHDVLENEKIVGNPGKIMKKYK